MGVYVSEVIEGQAAYNAGILAGDIITGFNGLPIFVWDQLFAAIRSLEIGDIVEVRILRDGITPLTVELELGQFITSNF